MRVDCAGFEVETLINIRIAKAGLVVDEVPSFERDRIHGTSNLSTRSATARACCGRSRPSGSAAGASGSVRPSIPASRVRVALVTPRYAPQRGALARQVEGLARAVIRQGGTVVVLTQSMERRLPKVEDRDGVTIRRFPAAWSSRTLMGASGLWDHLRRTASSYDLVHVHDDLALLAVAAARGHARRLLFTPHSLGELVARRPLRRDARLALIQAAGVVCTSRSMAGLLVQSFPGISGNVAILPQGADLGAIRTAAPIDVSGTAALLASRLVPGRLTERAIAAVAGLPPSFSLVVVGDGPARRSLRAFAADLRVLSRVHFLGRLEDRELLRWQRSAHVAVSLAPEASGLAALEALAAGTPVVASDTPAHREVAAYVGAGGVELVPLEASPLAVADAISRAAALGRTVGLERPIPSSAWVADTTVGLYEDVVAGRGLPRETSEPPSSRLSYPGDSNGAPRPDRVR